MKSFIPVLMLCCLPFISYSQVDTAVSDTITYRIVKTDGGVFIGKILSSNSREVLILTEDNREIYIPQHVIEEMAPLKASDLESKDGDKFATRYFITTNALPVKKGEHYVQWNLYGPDFQFSLNENLGVGVMTTWFGIPIIANAKYSFELGEKSQLAVGVLAGTGSWAAPDYGVALPFGTISFGDRSANIAFSGGYGAVMGSEQSSGSALGSIAGMVKVGSKISLVFDSFILMPEEGTMALLIPGLRWHQGEGKAFQIGFVGAYGQGELVPVPIPMLQWYRLL